jgi:hypothetical protein
MAGRALPAALGIHPSVGETTEVFVWFSLVGAFGVIDADDYCRVSVHAYFDVLNGECGGYELRIFYVSQELAFIADLAVIFGVYEGLADHAIQGTRISIHLRLVPQMFHHQKFVLLRVVSGRLRKRLPERN